MDKLGTDEMHVASRNLLLEGNPNVATLDGKPVKVSNYLDHIVAGFASTYRLLAAWRQELTEGPLEASRGDEIRVILSATEIYAHIIRASYHPHYLRDALERDRILDRIWPFPEMGDPYLRVSPSERRDLQAGDIPYFSTRADSCDLLDSRNQRMPDFLPTSGFQAALKRLRGLCERDLERQIRCIRSTFATIPVGQDDNQAPSFVLKSPAGEAPPQQILQMAKAVGDRLSELAFVQGSLASWLGVSPFREREWRFVSVGSDLYSGCAGIALFLAYLGKITGDDAPRALARAALGTSLEFVWAAEKVDELAPVGLFCGLGGPIYMLSHLGSLWQEPALLDRAEQMALAMERRVLASKEFDLFEGAAGFVASVLSLYRARPSAALLDFARRCGDHIVSHAIQSDGLPGLHWPCGIPSAAPLAGLSHGAAGIALNLMRLWKATDDDRYRRAAEGALEYERSVFSPEAGNWPDFLTFPSSAPVNADAALHREPGFVPRFKTAWCHGAPDTGLSRVAILRITDDPRMRAEIDVAVEATLKEGFGNNHCLCHGDLGNLELLISAPPREQLAADIARLSAAITESITEKGWITGNPLGIESPGLMSGIAGTGFGLLRLLAPQDVPSILLLEPPVAN